jgi:hypothetical protein
VWQVKVEGAATTPDCNVDLDGLFPPSGGRLTSRAQVVPPSDDPCVLSPTGGFRGLENRLYRVEIHDPGPLGTARFKWSRDNASVVSVVEDIIAGPPAQLTVSRIGRDSVLRFRIGDWVEVRDDHREWMGEPGEMARITAIDEENRTLTLDRALGGRPFGAGAALRQRHTNVIRWDQQNGIVGSTGLVATAAGFIGLEDGVEISFAGSSADFQVGDFWVFAARTIDGSVEELIQAPPRGIIHHYSQLATVTGLGPGGSPSVVRDCRPIWPPGTGDSCCTRVVHPGESIQAAVDSLPPEGGCVCLKTGIHPISTTIVIRRPNVLMHGESIGARVVGQGNLFTLLRIESENVTVAYIRFDTGERRESTEGLISISGGQDIEVRECILRSGARDLLGTPLVGIHVEKSNRVVLERNQILEMTIGALIEAVRFIDILENQIAVSSQALVGIAIRSQGGPYRIENNVIVNHVLNGIRVEDPSPPTTISPTTISYNRIQRREVGPGAVTADIKLFAIETRAENSVVIGNYMDLRDPQYGGIRVSGSHGRVEGNQIETILRAGQQDPLPLGILVQTATLGIPLHHVKVTGNILTGRQDAIVVRGGETRDAIGIQILENVIEGDAETRPRSGIRIEFAIDTLIQLNQVIGAQFGILLTGGTGNQLLENQLTDGVIGLLWNREGVLRVSGNSIENMSSIGLVGSFTDNLKCDHNRLASCGFSITGVAALITAIRDNLTIESCQIVNAGQSRDGTTTFPGNTGGLLANAVRNGHISENQIVAAPNLNTTLEHRAIVLQTQLSESVELLNNVAIGVGRTHLIEVATPRGKITFSNNRCEHTGVPIQESPLFGTVALNGADLSVLGNQIRADQRSFLSFNFANVIRLTAMGNITSGLWTNTATRPAPKENFNFIAI